MDNWGFIRACAVMDILSDAGAHTLGIDETETGVFGVSVNGFGIHTTFTKQELITTDERLHQFLSEYLVNITDRPDDPYNIEGLPQSLVKSTFDVFYYILSLRSGLTIVFESSVISDDHQWVHLRLHDVSKGIDGIDWNFERGIDVRVSDIMWVADGSS